LPAEETFNDEGGTTRNGHHADDRYFSRNEVWEALKHYTDLQVEADAVDTAHELFEATIRQAVERSENECVECGDERDGLKPRTISGDQLATWWNKK
jgi:hypothetical protein